jgi:hypothetical protein
MRGLPALRLPDMLVTEGCVVNLKRTYRVYREEGLQVRKRLASNSAGLTYTIVECRRRGLYSSST